MNYYVQSSCKRAQFKLACSLPSAAELIQSSCKRVQFKLACLLPSAAELIQSYSFSPN
ncbi:hypothetical protein HMPREF3202_00201 [Prevotella bivia]|uniref:Uncharacterized protein n=1 Tax=Prevotella bivia TaxID=28125 RepID=A0A137T0W8_9BACT|nr:hypothetical protein HMPREF3202_00201 [Prevotella bivia]